MLDKNKGTILPISGFLCDLRVRERVGKGPYCVPELINEHPKGCRCGHRFIRFTPWDPLHRIDLTLFCRVHFNAEYMVRHVIMSRALL